MQKEKRILTLRISFAAFIALMMMITFFFGQNKSYMILIFVILAATDLFLTHLAFFKYKIKGLFEISMLPALAIKHQKNKWWINQAFMILIMAAGMAYLDYSPALVYLLGLQSIVIFSNFGVVLKHIGGK